MNAERLISRLKTLISVHLLVYVMLVIFCPALSAQKKVVMDSSNITVRSIDDKALQNLQQDDDFKYNRYKEPAKSIWDKFWSWFWSRVDAMMRTKQGRITTWTLLILFATAVIVFFVLKLTGMNKAGLFGRKSGDELLYHISEDDIHNIPFDYAINEAILKGDFRLALRLLYLQSLKILADREYINWEINKTNSDYLTEVNNRPWYSLFQSLTLKFEYSWYGERNIGRDDFEHLRTQFKHFNNQLQ